MIESALLDRTPEAGKRSSGSILASVLTHCLLILALVAVGAPVQHLVTRYEAVPLTAPSRLDRPPLPTLTTRKPRPAPRLFVPRKQTQPALLAAPPPVIEATRTEPLFTEDPAAIPPPPSKQISVEEALPKAKTGVFSDVAAAAAESPAADDWEQPATGAFLDSTPRPDHAAASGSLRLGKFGPARLEQAAFLRSSRTQPAIGTFAGSEHPTPAPDSSNDLGGATGFGDYRAASPSRQASLNGKVAPNGGFGAIAIAPPPATAPGAGEIGNSGFGEVTASQAVPRDAVQQTEVAAETPLEILGKPRPKYTEEGRRLQIEGEVAVEARFAANGQIRVLRVIRGLGHGLDERAKRATEAIRFRPARRNGNPIDSVAVVRITFQLAY